jgi:hypothetical protein
MDSRQRKLAQQRNRRLQKRIFYTFKKQQQAQPCDCKCGGYAKPGNKFINGHYRPKGKNHPSYGKSYNKGIPKKKWRSFEEARKYACSLGLKSQKRWFNHCKSGKKPDDIPDTPYRVYKGKGWTGWTDFLGYIPKQMKPGSALSYEEATKVIQLLHIPDQKTFFQLSKQKKLPNGIPGNPNKVYKGKGWTGFPDFLGYIPKKIVFLDISYEQAKKVIQPLKIQSERHLINYLSKGNYQKAYPVTLIANIKIRVG